MWLSPTKGRGVKGGLGGRPRRGRLPPRTTQRKEIYGLGPPGGGRWHMNNDGPLLALIVNDAKPIRVQGIRTL